MTESASAVIADVPEATNLGWVRTRSHVKIGDAGSIDENTGGVPGVNVRAERAGLPAEGARAIFGESGGDGGAHRAACAARYRGIGSHDCGGAGRGVAG